MLKIYRGKEPPSSLSDTLRQKCNLHKHSSAVLKLPGFCYFCTSPGLISPATKCTSLSILAYNNCGVIPSIQFIQKMNSLSSFRFVGTDIADGDITPCIGLGYAGFSNKKHFSHTIQEIKNLSRC